MKRIHIVGGKNHGKTTLVTELVAEFRSRGMVVGTIKHTHHHHELDTPGKDSYRHRLSGATVAGILSRSMNAVFWRADVIADRDTESDDAESRYQSFAPAFSHCDIVLVEGDTCTKSPKLEVWRAVNGTPPVADRLTNVRAIVTDDSLETAFPVLTRSHVAAIADFILASRL